MKQLFKKPSYYLLSQQWTGTKKRLKNYWHFMTLTYQSAVCVHSMMNTAMLYRCRYGVKRTYQRSTYQNDFRFDIEDMDLDRRISSF